MPRLEAASNPIFCALDTTDHGHALELAHALKGSVGGLKLGLEYCHANGPDRISEIARLGLPMFMDLKLNDIPNTVSGAMRAVQDLKPAFVTVHALGGSAMVKAAVDVSDSYRQSSGHQIHVLGVTVLTSLDDEDLKSMGVNLAPAEEVAKLAALARNAGASGIVCSPFEIEIVRQTAGPDAVIVVPGIRPAGANTADQKRIMGPKEALDLGADYLVIGRPITEARDPGAVAGEILASLEITEAA